MARVPGWVSGTLASGPLTHHGQEQVPDSRSFQGSPAFDYGGTAAGDATRGSPRTGYWARTRRPVQILTRCGDQHARAGNRSPTRAPTARRLPSEGAPSGDAILLCFCADRPRPRNTSGRLCRHCGKHAGPDLGIRPSGPAAPCPTSGVNVFSFTAGFFATDATSHCFQWSLRILWTIIFYHYYILF